mmetsp:Transcript_56196/g.111686  ORF Transcript_56196/g.111686 Transcript_56196/m.111686 type:complete len:463 (+) Transcript_56196:77-1465(+)
MAWAQETGVDFFRRITAEVKVVQDDVGDLQRLAADLRSSILSESRIRDNELTKVHDRILQERTAEAQIRATLEARLEDFEAKTNTRFKELEQLMPTKAPLLHLQKLEADVALLKTEVERDFSTTTQSIRTVAAAAAHDFKIAQDGMERAHAYSEAAKKMLASELSTLTTKVDTVDAFAQTRAKALDLQALEPRVYEAERSLERTNQELNTKASAGIVNDISGRVSGLTMDLQAHQARTLADKESLFMHVGTVEKALEKHGRQQDADRDRASNAILAVEREMSTKALKAETDLIGPNTLRAAHDVVESRAQRLEQHIAVARQEQVPYRHRLEALEVAFPTKADAAEIPRLTLSISDSNSRHEAAYRRAQEHGMRLDKFDSHINNHVIKLEGLESRGNVLDAKVNTKAEVTDHFTKDNVVELLKEFYRKEEVDAMLSRVWWRVGDVTKGRITNAPGTSPRSVLR